MKKILTALLLILLSLPSLAQETTGNLQGTIKDNQNNPIPFANVVLTDIETNFTYGAISQENGFSAPLLPYHCQIVS